MYAVSASVQGAARFEIPLDKDLGVDPVALTEHLPAAVKIVFLCSPNNPTGGQLSLGLIERVARALSARALVVVDEAYVEFSGAASASGLLDRHENLAVLRTLSKAHALAAARVGCVIASPAMIAALRRCQAPYPVRGIDLLGGHFPTGEGLLASAALALVGFLSCLLANAVVRSLAQPCGHARHRFFSATYVALVSCPWFFGHPELPSVAMADARSKEGDSLGN
jgi:hypothetical protein